MSTQATADAFPIDGGILEGGGQRLQLVANIASSSSQPSSLLGGVTPKPAKSLQEGGLGPAKVGHDMIRFLPGRIGGDELEGVDKLEYVSDTGTAGSIGLLIQVSLPVLLFADKPSEVVMRGGTNAESAPQIDFTIEVLLPFLREHVFRGEAESSVDLIVRRRGYFPKGGGEVQMNVNPVAKGKTLSSFQVTDRGVPVRVGGRAFVAGNLPAYVADKMQKAIAEGLRGSFPHEVINRGRDIEVVKDSPEISVGTAMGCQIWIETSTGCRITGSSLGAPRTSAEDVGKKAAEMLLEQWSGGGCCDEYLQDQILIFMALAEGTSKVLSGPLSLHSETAMHIAKELTGASFRVTPLGDGTPRLWIEVEGIAYSPR
ncbi:hypothetical protein HDU67_000497 [Dinochytrium kinnereticum]|nr:hypothetical protein HDU67_000497 [Dinochytrium kinnereticum]